MDSFLEAYERENKIVWGRVDELEAEEKRLKARIEKLEEALRALSATCDCWAAVKERGKVIKLLEGKDE
jgi:hypothetical protein